MSDITERVQLLVVLWLSLSVHEWAHARAAALLGDPTARELGRDTLDPTAHIDWIGTVLLPILGVPFGWAVPVPVNPLRFRPGVGIARGMAIVAVAGPLSNLVLAAASALILAVTAGLPYVPRELLALSVAMNAGLMVFNLLPIPPLDGSRVVSLFLPRALLPWWETWTRSGILSLLLLYLAAPWLSSAVVRPIVVAMLQLAF